MKTTAQSPTPLKTLPLALALICSHSFALAPQRATTPSTTTATAPAPIQYTKTFAELAGVPNEPLRLQSTNAAYTFKVPFAPRESASSATIHLETTNSTALIRSRSELAVRLNGQIIAQYSLDPENTRNIRDIQIPAQLLKTGYNDLTVSAVQHYTYECEDPGAPELWTEIDPATSTVTLSNVSLNPNAQPSMAELDLAFDAKAWSPKKIAVILDPNNSAHITAAATAIQGIALRYGFQPVNIKTFSYPQALSPSGHASAPAELSRLNTDIAADHDFLIIGDIPTLSQLIDPSYKQTLSKSPSAVAIAPVNSSHVALIVTGSSPENLITAAKAIALPGYKFSDAPAVGVSSQTPGLFAFNSKSPSSATGPSFTPDSYIATPKLVHKISSFGFNTQTSRGFKLQPIYVNFKAPPEWGARNGDKATLGLHLAYGAGLRKDSSMTININGHRTASLPLSNEQGAEFNNFEIKIPAEFIQPGPNAISFEPVFIAHKDKCDMLRDEHLFLTLFEDTTLTLPAASVPPAAPDLQRTSQGLWPHADTFNIYPLNTSNDTLSATLTTLATLAQKNKQPLNISTSFDISQTAPTFIFGAYAQANRIDSPSASASAPPSASLPLSKYNWTANNTDAAVFQFHHANQPVTAFLASSPQQLLLASQALHPRTHNVWNQLKGHATIIDTNNYSLSFEYPQPKDVKAHSQASSLASQFGFNTSKIQLAAIALSILTFVGAFSAILRQRKKRREAATPSA